MFASSMAFPPLARVALVFTAVVVAASPVAGQVRTPPPAATAAVTRVTIHELPSTVLGETRTVFVRTPVGFTQGRRYPVLYLTDAEAQFSHTATTVEFLARQGRVPELLVVGVTNTNRGRDLTPTRAIGGNGQPVGGGADAFLDFFERELIPFVEQQYQALPYRIFAGHSLGGMFAIHAMTARPGLFKGLIAVSPALQWDKDVVLERARAGLPSGDASPRSLIVTLGKEPGDITRTFDAFEALLRKSAPKSLSWVTRRFDEEDHGSVVLPSHYFALREIFKGWPLAIDGANPDTACSMKRVTTHYAEVAAGLGWRDMPVPEPALNLLGYRCLGAGRHADALAAFEKNAALYPDSANVYDSLGEGLEAAGKLDLAIVQYRKAVSVSETHPTPLAAIFRQHLADAEKKAARTP